MIALLVIIYAAFISLGLPDSLLGSAWPAMQTELGASISAAGYIAMTVQAGTIVSSLFSNRLISKFGTGKITAVSVALTAAALAGYSLAPNVWFLFICAVPMGLGAGSVDAALNNFVALHYKARHMSWLHCFWGIGATIGPMIVSLQLASHNGWRRGYIIIAFIQAALVVTLFATLPLWKKVKSGTSSFEESESFVSNREALKIPDVKLALVSFIFFCATETTTGLWSSSYMTLFKGLSASDAAMIVSCFYGAITLGRLISGFVTMRIGSAQLIRTGQLLCVAATVMVILPLPTFFSIAGIALIGLGTAPIFPGMLHETPARFGEKASQAVVGLEMAFAYIGSALAPPLFGSLTSATNISIFPYFILFCALIMLIASELLKKRL